jgi:hypothetical protein
MRESCRPQLPTQTSSPEAQIIAQVPHDVRATPRRFSSSSEPKVQMSVMAMFRQLTLGGM